ncbi:hypothetical protein POVCU1_017460 [Plasmodium ovale curtisi]|uniref:Uncharacterized protein n=1 Tax=Plasmodium ovale curtisi TaxID=864141 RepID=A0A1A8WAK3_PLAOA|nr:hypothetical protein POVCU1_017460 [Plasmodium ovale curtisi]
MYPYVLRFDAALITKRQGRKRNSVETVAKFRVEEKGRSVTEALERITAKCGDRKTGRGPNGKERKEKSIYRLPMCLFTSTDSECMQKVVTTHPIAHFAHGMEERLN